MNEIYTNNENVCQGSGNNSNEESLISSCPVKPKSHEKRENDDNSGCMTINDVPLRVLELVVLSEVRGEV